jgi:IclR family transcriptional regulator, KDG regulon repressor
MPQKTKRKSNYTSSVPAVEQTARILQYLSSSPGFKANLADISRNVSVHSSKAYAILNTLQTFGHILRDDDAKLYSLGPGLISLGRQALEGMDYRSLARPHLSALAEETHCTALFEIIAGKSLVVVALEESKDAVTARIKLGDIHPLHYRAHGIAMAAFLPEKERAQILAGENQLFNEQHPGIDYAQLEPALSEIRRKGYMLEVGPYNHMIKILISPVLNFAGQPIGSMFIVGIFPESVVSEYGVKLAEKAAKMSSVLATGQEEVLRRLRTTPETVPHHSQSKAGSN